MGNIVKGTSNSVAPKPCDCPSAGEIVINYINGLRQAGNKEDQQKFIENFLKIHFDQQTDIDTVKKWSLDIAARQVKSERRVSIQEPGKKSTDAKTAKKSMGINKKKPAVVKKRKGGKAVEPKPIKAPAKGAGNKMPVSYKKTAGKSKSSRK